jgi:DNA primase
MAFPPAFLDEIRTRVPLADIVGKQVRLQRRGREFTGLCPFHREKSPSFSVVEDKGFFHCFGCGAHGDVIGFVMRTENLAFPEAVERLAGMAGLEMPRQSPQEREREKRAATLYDVLEEAARWFEQQLTAPEGGETRDYLQRRGVRPETVERFRLGYAPDGRNRLIRHLLDRGASAELIATAGLSAGGDDGRDPVDRFRHRLMFPIGDRSGRVIAFGGRTMGDHPAKYLNSPETPVFHKGRLLYGYAQARKAAHEAGTVIVSEGYMDVIALAQAGFTHAVAPLGTALTETQLALLWRIADEPILCFDGDNAGKAAAFRSVDRALPGLMPGKSLRFAMMPSGVDPDDLIKARGRGAMKEVLDHALPLLDMLWRQKTEGGGFDTPERRAGLERALQDEIQRIGDRTVQFHYQSAVRERLKRAFGPPQRVPQQRRSGRNWTGGRRQGGWKANYPDMERKPTRVPGAGAAGDRDRSERLLLAAPILVPGLLERVAERLAEINFATPGFDALRNGLLDALNAEEILDSEALQRHLTSNGLSELLVGLQASGGMADPSLRVEAVEEAERQWRHTFDLHQRHALREEIEADAVAWAEDQSEEAWQRLQAKQELREASDSRLIDVDGDAVRPGGTG